MTQLRTIPSPKEGSTRTEILQHYLKTINSADFLIATDGSGHKDTYGGASCVAISAKHGRSFTRVAGMNGVSTDRAEFLALLNALHGVLVEMNWDTKVALKSLKHYRAQIVWFCDRESLVYSVAGKYKRGTQPDLWAQLAWYEELMDIHPVHVKRDTLNLHNTADILASEARIVMKEYHMLFKECEGLKIKK